MRRELYRHYHSHMAQSGAYYAKSRQARDNGNAKRAILMAWFGRYHYESAMFYRDEYLRLTPDND